jgi:corrinoid protein of di/trimethylamine methyltransferase
MQTLENLKKSVLEYDTQAAAHYAQQIVQEGIDPLTALDAISAAMQIVGDGYSCGEMWLPDLVGAAGASQAAMPILEEEIRRRGEKTRSLGTIVLGTVKGDIHTIGKSMVGVLLVAAGFRVIDIGADVPTQKFVEAVNDNEADILALSALLTTTAPEQGKVIRALKEAGLRDKVKIMVGGGAITQEFAHQIGADGYGSTAPKAVELAKSLVRVPLKE